MISPTSRKGNDPERWNKFLETLDEKLQLGLLEYLRRVSSYHFEEEILYIEPSSQEDLEYLTKDTVFQQLELLAQDAIKIESVKIKKD
jgi:hypothetical protein